MKQALLDQDELERLYPSTDGVEMGESNQHYDFMTFLCENFRHVLTKQTASVHANLYWYPLEGQSHIRRAPDVMVIMGCEFRANRSSYAQALEGGVPATVVMEILSRSNTEGTMEERREWYEKYGVSEYYQIDDIGGHITVWLLVDGSFVEQVGITSFTSPATGVHFDWTDGIQITTPSGKPFQTALEIRHERDKAAREARKQEKRANKAEQELEETEQELEEAKQRAEIAQKRADELQRLLDELRRNQDS